MQGITFVTNCKTVSPLFSGQNIHENITSTWVATAQLIIYLRLNIKKINPAYTLLAFTLTCYNNAQDDTEDEQFERL